MSNQDDIEDAGEMMNQSVSITNNLQSLIGNEEMNNLIPMIERARLDGATSFLGKIGPNLVVAQIKKITKFLKQYFGKGDPHIREVYNMWKSFEIQLLPIKIEDHLDENGQIIGDVREDDLEYDQEDYEIVMKVANQTAELLRPYFAKLISNDETVFDDLLILESNSTNCSTSADTKKIVILNGRVDIGTLWSNPMVRAGDEVLVLFNLTNEVQDRNLSSAESSAPMYVSLRCALMKSITEFMSVCMIVSSMTERGAELLKQIVLKCDAIKQSSIDPQTGSLNLLRFNFQLLLWSMTGLVPAIVEMQNEFLQVIDIDIIRVIASMLRRTGIVIDEEWVEYIGEMIVLHSKDNDIVMQALMLCSMDEIKPIMLAFFAEKKENKENGDQNKFSINKTLAVARNIFNGKLEEAMQKKREREEQEMQEKIEEENIVNSLSLVSL